MFEIKSKNVLLASLVLALAACSSGGGSSDNDDTMNGDGPGAGGDMGGDMGDGNTGGNDGDSSGGDSGNGGDTGGGNASFGQPTASQIRPGVLVTAAGSACTSNFIYTDNAGNYFIGAAAHCFSPDTNSGIDSCETRNEEIGLAVSIENADHPGSLHYSSWRAMQENNETPGSNPCLHNDFALIKIDARDHDKVHPAAIAFEGPTALLRGNADVNEFAYSYGQSPSHFGIRANEEKNGPIQGQTGGGWQYAVSFDNPGLPGDSGSAVLHETGMALGVLTVVSAGISFPPVANGVMSLEMGLDYANDSLPRDVRLVTWDNFTP